MYKSNCYHFCLILSKITSPRRAREYYDNKKTKYKMASPKFKHLVRQGEERWACTCPTLGSRGTLPRRGTLLSKQSFSAPPVDAGRMVDSNLQLGQTNPLMFSTTPKMGRLTFRQKSISFLTSKRETS